VGGVTLDGARARFERRQVDLFRDEATVTRPATGGALDEESGEWTPTAATEIYDGVCLLRGFNWEGTDVQVGGDEARLRRLRAKFPTDTAIQRNDIVVPTRSTYDPSLVGRSFRVTDVPPDGWQIVRWSILEEVT
jgi:hypothetical protein